MFLNPHRFAHHIVDPDWSKVALLLQVRNSNGSLSIADDSALNNPVELIGNTEALTTVPKYNNGSIYIDSFGDGARIGNNAAFAIGTGDFTMEARVFPITNGNCLLATKRVYDSTGPGTYRWTAETFQELSVGTIIASQPPLLLQAWSDVAVSRTDGILRLFTNGIKTCEVVSTHDFTNPYGLQVGSDSDSHTLSADAYFNVFRVTIGKGRYINDYTPTTLPYPVG